MHLFQYFLPPLGNIFFTQNLFQFSHHFFLHRICSNIFQGKPAPDIFLKCAEFLESLPEHTIVVEDAIAGIQAIRNGQFGLALGIARNTPRKKLLDVGAHLVISDFSEISIWNIIDWFPNRSSDWVLTWKHFEPEKEKLREVRKIFF